MKPAILCTGGRDVIRKEAWLFCRTSSSVRLCWELEEPKGPEGWRTAGVGTAVERAAGASQGQARQPRGLECRFIAFS